MEDRRATASSTVPPEANTWWRLRFMAPALVMPWVIRDTRRFEAPAGRLLRTIGHSVTSDDSS